MQRKPLHPVASTSLLFAVALLGACQQPVPRADHAGQELGQDLARPGSRAAAVADPGATILRLMDRRSDGEGLLQALLVDGAEPSRVLAARALGTLPHPEYGAGVTAVLVRAVSRDEAAAVRAEAALALGLRRDPAAEDALLAALADPSEVVRARAVLGASLLAVDSQRMREAVLRALSDNDESVRAAAAVAPQRWSVKDTDAGVVDEALLAVLARSERLDAEPKDAPPVSAEVDWRVVSTLARRASLHALDPVLRATQPARAREAFLRAAQSARPRLERLFAMQGLGALPSDPERAAALRRGLEDSDWRVASEAALSLERGPDREAFPALLAAVSHPSHHVRQRVAAALGHYPDDAEASLPAIERLLNDASGAVRGAAIEADARLRGQDAAPDLAMRALDGNPFVRASIARATQLVPARRARPILLGLVRDQDPLVVGAAVEAWKAHLDEGGREQVHRALAAADLAPRLAAVEALRDEVMDADLAPLTAAYRAALGEGTGSQDSGSATLRASILERVAANTDTRAVELLLAGAVDPVFHVRRVARAALAAHHPAASPPSAPAPRRDIGDAPPPDLDALGDAPLVEILTTRGRMVFELLPSVAPFHVQNFLELARAGHYAGTRFHRVVPDFVIQGGDSRGDGNGAVSARGVPLRAELSAVEYTRGALGMPRSDDLDGGGGQIFVTHRPTPHLDLRYTLFGVLRSGGDVLDAIDVNDRIVEVRVR